MWNSLYLAKLILIDWLDINTHDSEGTRMLKGQTVHIN